MNDNMICFLGEEKKQRKDDKVGVLWMCSRVWLPVVGDAYPLLHKTFQNFFTL